MMRLANFTDRSGLNSSRSVITKQACFLHLTVLRPARYSSDALDRVLLIRFAGEMGFTLTETKVFLDGLRDDAPVGPRWKKLAHRKILEVEDASDVQSN